MLISLPFSSTLLKVPKNHICYILLAKHTETEPVDNSSTWGIPNSGFYLMQSSHQARIYLTNCRCLRTVSHSLIFCERRHFPAWGIKRCLSCSRASPTRTHSTHPSKAQYDINILSKQFQFRKLQILRNLLYWRGNLIISGRVPGEADDALDSDGRKILLAKFK